MKDFFIAKKILPCVYAITGEAVARYLIIGKKRALLFDTGYGFADLKKFVRTITDLPLDVVISHGHVDHAGANCYFEEAVYMNFADLPVYEHHQSREFRKISFDVLNKVQKIAFFYRHIIPKNYSEEEYLSAPLYKNFVDVKEGYVFDLGGLSAEVVEIPGHTPGSIGLYCKELRLFLASDGINGGVWLFLPESCNLLEYICSLKKAEKLDFDYLLTGHSTELVPKSTLQDYLDVAENLDFENGKIQKENAYVPGVEVRACGSKSNKKNKARICICADKL